MSIPINRDRSRYLQELRNRCRAGQALPNTLYQKKWSIYARRPLAYPSSVVEYLGRYTHKVAMRIPANLPE